MGGKICGGLQGGCSGWNTPTVTVTLQHGKNRIRLEDIKAGISLKGLEPATIANVVAGTVLLAACWWLREALSTTAPITLTQRPIIRVTLAIFVLHVSLGAASSDSQMRGIHWVAFVHSGSAMLTALLLGSILWDHRKNAQSARMVVAMACLLAIQLVLGLVSIWMAARPIGLDFVHAMLSPLLLAGLVSLNLKDGLQENSL